MLNFVLFKGVELPTFPFVEITPPVDLLSFIVITPPVDLLSFIEITPQVDLVLFIEITPPVDLLSCVEITPAVDLLSHVVRMRRRLPRTTYRRWWGRRRNTSAAGTAPGRSRRDDFGRTSRYASSTLTYALWVYFRLLFNVIWILIKTVINMISKNEKKIRVMWNMEIYMMIDIND